MTRAAGPEQRSTSPLAQLSRQLNSACTAAVQPLELAAILEAEGLTDSLAQQRYGEVSVFSCAERLYGMVPYRAPGMPVVRAAPRPLPVRSLLRGGLYLLPALWSPALLALAPAADVFHGAGLGLLSASLFGWGWMQGVAYVGFTGLAFAPAVAALRLRRAGMAAAALGGGLAFALAAALGQDPTLVTLAALSVSVYLAAATALLVLGQEVTLLTASLPALLWLGVTRVWPGAADLSWAALPLPPVPAITLLLAVGGPLLAAWEATRHAGLAGAVQGSWRPVPWTQAGLHCVYGWLCAAAMSLVFLLPLSGLSPDAAGLTGLSWSLAPLVLTLGFMEFSTARVHRNLRLQAQRPDPIGRIVWGALGQVGAGAGRYLALLAGTYLAAGGVTAALSMTALPVPLLAGHLLMALSLLLSSLLNNFGLLPRVLIAWTVAVGVQLGALFLTGPETAYLLGAGAAAVSLSLLTVLAVRDVRHLM
ncbi:hypothetical protein [Deinococcus sp. LM3]|uniref:hypothetical protein n=1 Tax=Deinococcus sp. LM3 TaxID=1938608 RepID=UPI000993093C|nr:hypothetical protein [Deinococcus sp. LM3]